jgi:D-tyrosyl-tRNA(Tyr) deacylase
MRALIQRVSCASVAIEEEISTEIGPGLMILLGIEIEDTPEDVGWLCRKIIQLRIFDDNQGIMNLPISEVDGEVLAVSQFTLLAKTKKGNRPSYVRAARPEVAIPLYSAFVKQLGTMLGKTVKTGEFGANMQVSLTNDGPVTILIDTKNKE